jgi:hypothetical protein
MSTLLLIFVALLIVLAFLYTKKPAVNATGVSGTGPGYIPPFQGYPGSGVSGV